MKLEATIKSVVDDLSDISVTIRGWSDTDPVGTQPRALGTINIPSTPQTRKAYHIGRRIFIEVKPA